MLTFQFRTLFWATMALVLSGCAAPMQRIEADAAKVEAKDRLTLGKVQQNLQKGMGKDEIIAAMGSPNMVTKDRSGQETWIYDKIFTEVNSAVASDSVGIGGGVWGGNAAIGGIAGQSNAAARATRTQKTLTVILKFKGDVLAEYSYNSTSF